MFHGPTRQATVTWHLDTAAIEPATGETLLAITATVSAAVADHQGRVLTRSVTVYRALE